MLNEGLKVGFIASNEYSHIKVGIFLQPKSKVISLC